MAPEKGHTAYPPDPGPTHTTKYPRRKFHATEGWRDVQNEEEEEALGKGWEDAPIKQGAKAAGKDKGKGAGDRDSDNGGEKT